MPTLPEQQRTDLVIRVLGRWSPPEHVDWRTWSLGRYQAWQAVAGCEAETGLEVGLDEPRYVIMAEEDYRELVDVYEDSYISGVKAGLEDVAAGRVRQVTAQQLIDEFGVASDSVPSEAGARGNTR